MVFFIWWTTHFFQPLRRHLSLLGLKTTKYLSLKTLCPKEQATCVLRGDFSLLPHRSFDQHQLEKRRSFKTCRLKKAFDNGMQRATSFNFLTLRFGVVFVFLSFLSLLNLFGGGESVRPILQSGEVFGQEKARGFSGYLLDSSNLIGGTPIQEELNGWQESFETSGISWRYLFREGDVTPLEHQRTEEVWRSGNKSEKIVLDFNDNAYVFLGHYIDYPLFFNDIEPSLWLRSDRPNVTLGLLIVLPETPRPDTGLPLTFLLHGSTYRHVGDWEQLTLPQNVEQSFKEMIQAIRGEYKIPVNPEGAYIRQMVLLVEGRQGKQTLWIDDLEILHHAPTSQESLQKNELGSFFNPMNILSFRLAVSDVPIFLGIDSNNPHRFGKEPFGFDETLVQQRRKERERKLRFRVPNDWLNAQRSFQTLQNFEPGENHHDSLSGQGLPGQQNKAASFDGQSQANFSAEAPDKQDGINGLVSSQSSSFQTNSDAILSTNIGSAGYFSEDPLLVQQHVTPVLYSSQDSEPVPLSLPGDLSPQNVLPPPPEGQAPNAQTAFSPVVSGSGTLSGEDGTQIQRFPEKPVVLPSPEFKGNFLTLVSPEKNTEYFGVRAIEYQGESFKFLKDLHFNTIWLHQPPTAMQLQEAAENDLWLIAPPPVGDETLGASDQESIAVPEGVPAYFNRQPVGALYDRVLIWTLGVDHREPNLQTFRMQKETINQLDSQRSRPVIAHVASNVYQYTFSRSNLDALLVRRQPLLTSLELSDYGHWLDNYKHILGTPNFPYWCEIQTQADAQLLAQSRFFGAVDEMPSLISYEQIRQLVRLSLSSGCHGFLFTSDTPLDASDRPAQYRAAALELINLELCLLDWWFAGGEQDAIVSAHDPVLSASILKRDYTVLLLPYSIEKKNQFALGATAVPKIDLIAPAKDGYSAEYLVPGVFRKVVSDRRAGGVHLNVEDANLNSLIFLTQSGLHQVEIGEKAPQLGPRMAELAIRLAKMRLDTFQQTLYQLVYLREHDSIPVLKNNRSLLDVKEQETLISQTRTAIKQAEEYLQQKDDAQAYLQAERAVRDIRELERSLWKTATRYERSLPVLPVSVAFPFLPSYLETYKKLNNKQQLSENRLVAGDMEDTTLWNSKWTGSEEPINGVTSTVVRDDGSGHSGQTGLRLENVKTDKAPLEFECPTILLRTSFPVKTGELICVQGWVNLPEKLEGTCDGLMIYDDHGGPALAQRFIDATGGWKQFAFYRYAAYDGDMTLCFSLAGYGQVLIDDVAANAVLLAPEPAKTP